MSELVGQVGNLGWVAVKASLLFLTAVVGFRLAERRTPAEMSAFDFVAAVAVGAIVGRVPNATTTSYVQGAVTLVTILTVHAVLTRLRYLPRVANWIDHPPRLLVVHGRVDERQLQRSGLTREDLFGLLRQHNVNALAEVRYVVFDQRGKVTVVREAGRLPQTRGDLLAAIEPGTGRLIARVRPIRAARRLESGGSTPENSGSVTIVTVEELRLALIAFKEQYNARWLIERHGHRTPNAVRRQCEALAAAA